MGSHATLIVPLFLISQFTVRDKKEPNNFAQLFIIIHATIALLLRFIVPLISTISDSVGILFSLQDHGLFQFPYHGIEWIVGEIDRIVSEISIRDWTDGVAVIDGSSIDPVDIVPVSVLPVSVSVLSVIIVPVSMFADPVSPSIAPESTISILSITGLSSARTTQNTNRDNIKYRMT